MVGRVGITGEQAAKRIRGDEPSRSSALAFIAKFLYKYRAFSKFASKLIEEGEVFNEESTSIRAALEPKSTETIRKRAGAIRMYEGWLTNSVHKGGDPFDEHATFQYLAFLNSERVPATRGATFRESVHWMGFLFGFDVEATQRSSRVRGMALRLLKTRGVLRQRDPLSVEMVISLENTAIDDPDDYTVVIAGAALFVLYTRARVGDVARSCTEPFLDLSADMSEGYIQGALLDHKTAKPGTRQSLPLAAPAIGVTGRNWAAAWLEARRRQRLHASCGSLLQAPSVTGGWTQAPLSTMEFGSAFRSVLLRNGFGAESLSNIGSHSLKTTTLSWLAKAGVDRDTRRALGYHVRSDERSMEAYSRDSLAGPLRILAKVIADIRAKKFNPDATRSGLFAAPAPIAGPPSPSSSTCSSRPSSASSLVDSGDDDFKDDEEAQEPDEPELQQCIIRNDAKQSGFYHIFQDGKLACGKVKPLKFTFFDEPPEGARLCAKCF